MRKSYKDFPVDDPNPLYPNRLRWEPLLLVRLGYHHAVSQRFFAYVDSGSGYCMFKWELATLIGLDPKKSPLHIDEIGGAIQGVKEPIYYHKIKLYVEALTMIEVTAGFVKKLNASGILGRTGFFDNFKVVFDHSGYPFEIEKIARAN